MSNSGRSVGIGLLVAAGILEFLVLAWGLTNLASGNLEMSGLILLIAIFLPITGLMAVAGIVVYRRAQSEATEMAGVQQQRKILNMVQTRGQVTIADAALETGMNRDEVRNAVYDLVGKGLFTGYVDWDQGTLFSRQARDMRAAGVCPNCGGKLELAGKGVIKCPYCGTEVFV